jgi:beta-phosphoglucomutase-like phosphatase (HAD superfamily)
MGVLQELRHREDRAEERERREADRGRAHREARVPHERQVQHRLRRRQVRRARASSAHPDWRRQVVGLRGGRDCARDPVAAVVFGIDGVLISTADEPSVEAVAKCNEALVAQRLGAERVSALPGSVGWLEQLRPAGTRAAVVSTASNSLALLDATGVSALFDAQVDGDDIDRLGLRRRPAPDAYREATSRLTVHPIWALVVEAVLAGVAAARTGGFGLVIGIARNAPRAELRAAGAALVVDDVGELVGRNSVIVDAAGYRQRREEALQPSAREALEVRCAICDSPARRAPELRQRRRAGVGRRLRSGSRPRERARAVGTVTPRACKGEFGRRKSRNLRESWPR